MKKRRLKVLNDAKFNCLCCQGEFFKEKHECTGYCFSEGRRHSDFCDTCVTLSIASFEAQVRRKLFPRLKLED
jgi:hypothetical protein